MTTDTISLSLDAPGSHIWPLGEGSVVTVIGKNDHAGMLYMFAVPDHLYRADWREVATDEIPTAHQLAALGGPWSALQFKDRATVDRFISFLGKVREELPADLETGR